MTLIEKMAHAIMNAPIDLVEDEIDNAKDQVRAALAVLSDPANVTDEMARAAMEVWKRHLKSGDPTSLAQWKEAIAAAIKAGAA